VTGRSVETGSLGLLLAVLERTPRLPEALCSGRAPEFDCTDGAGVERAIALCRVCPELEPCIAWAAGQRQLAGVVAGTLYREKEWR
jgi:hypothetical protein